MLPFLLALALQLPDSVYATPALRAMVARAAAANRAVPPALRSYRARAESEIALLVHRPEGDELAAQIEQVASVVRWARDGSYEQHVVGYRAQAVGLGFSAVSYFPSAWTVPVLYGNRLSLFFGAREPAQRAPAGRRPSRRRGSVSYAVHPFAQDRDAVYRFTGGDTVATIVAGGRAIRVARVGVEPRLDAPALRREGPPGGSARGRGSTLLFSGEADIDADRHQIIRLRGRFVTVGARRTLRERVLRATVDAVAYVELVNAEVQGAYWLPSYQRVELAASTWLSESRSVFRIVTRFRDYQVNDLPAAIASAPLDPAADTLAVRPHRLSFAPRDSVSRWKGWEREIGIEAAASNARDFDDVAPERLRPTGPPRLAPGGRRLSEWVRYDRVEGLYTGAAAALRFRDAAPGLTLRAHGGWAWTERAARGAVDATLARGGWRAEARAERQLAHTNDFTSKLDPGAALAVFGYDPYDYVDRRAATLAVARELGRQVAQGAARARAVAVVRVDGGAGSDRAAARNLREPPLGRDTFRLNRPAAEGRYLRAAATVELRPEVSGEFLQPGLGAMLRYEVGHGELDWQRAELRVVARRTVGALTLAARGDAGALLGGAARPPQQLFELGSEEGLPGYAYKAFSGDRALIARGAASYDLGLLRTPVRVWRRFRLPGIAPTPAVGVQAGWTGASSEGRAALDALGWRASGGVRTTVEVGLRFFGGAVRVGAARAVDRRDRWSVVWGLGGAL